MCLCVGRGREVCRGVGVLLGQVMMQTNIHPTSCLFMMNTDSSLKDSYYQ